MKPSTALTSRLAGLLLLTLSSPGLAAGWLGIGAGPVRGAEIREVVKDGPADKAGLKQGDVILHLNDQEVRDLPHFLVMVSSGKPGDAAVLKVLRNGAPLEIRTTFDDSANHAVLPAYPTGVSDGTPLDFHRGAMPGYYPGALLQPGHSHDLLTRIESVKSLLDAFERIRTEKKLEDTDKVGSRIRELLIRANEAQTQYRLEEATLAVEEAYILARDGLKKLRHGETLISKLTFKSPMDEYTYELNRNNMFQMLMRGLPDGGKVLSKDKGVKLAQKRRKDAEGVVKKDVAQAIKLLEESSDMFIQALLSQTDLDLPPELKR